MNDQTRKQPASLPEGDPEATMSPGDTVPPDAPAAGENVCRECEGEGTRANGERCAACGGTGKVHEPVSAGE